MPEAQAGAYRVLARKYRPQTFADLIGQEAVVRTLANAFATGRDPQHASVAITRGLLDKLDREELQGVIGHELGHVKNLDMQLMTLMAGLVGAVVGAIIVLLVYGMIAGRRRGV